MLCTSDIRYTPHHNMLKRAEICSMCHTTSVSTDVYSTIENKEKLFILFWFIKMANGNIRLRQAIIGTMIVISITVTAFGFRKYVWKNDVIFFNPQQDQRNGEQDENNNEQREEDNLSQSGPGIEIENSAPNGTGSQNEGATRRISDSSKASQAGGHSVVTNEKKSDETSNIYSSPPSWRVELTGQSSSGVVNPGDEVAKYFKEPTVFTECWDTEIKNILEPKKKREQQES